MTLEILSTGPAKLSAAARTEALREASIKLEAQFLAEMLKSSGFDGQSDGFGGGVGEDQYTSFLREAQADAMARSGGIGLAESLFQALKARDNV